MTRRDFLKSSAAALAVATLDSVTLPAPKAAGKKRDLKKAYMLGTFPGKDLPLLEKFKLLKAAGFEGVEPPSHLDQDEVLRARDETGLAIPSVSCGKHSRALSHASAEQRASAVEGVKQALRDAKRYGASSILVVPGGVSEETSYAEAYQRTQAELRKAVPLAAELGVKLAVENVWNHFLLSPMEAARFVDEFNSPAVGWHFDVGNVIYLGWPEQWIRILGRRIQKLHIKEFSRKKMNEQGLGAGFQVAYLQGDNNWPAIMKALDEIGYNGWGIAEQGGGDSPEGLKDLSQRMSRVFAS